MCLIRHQNYYYVALWQAFGPAANGIVHYEGTMAEEMVHLHVLAVWLAGRGSVALAAPEPSGSCWLGSSATSPSACGATLKRRGET